MFNLHLLLRRFSTSYSPQVSCCFKATIRSDLAYSLPESHLSILATAPEKEGGTKVGSSTEKDASYSTLGIREDNTATLDTAQLASSPPVTDVVTDDPSTHPLGIELMGRRPLDPMHSPYDIV